MTQDKKPEQKEYPEVLVHIADHVARRLSEKGVPEAEAARIGLECAEEVRAAFGGEPIYLPKGVSFDCSKRDMEILEMFNGSNFRDVCQKFNISKARVYQILQATRLGRQGFFDFHEEPDDGKA